MNKNVTLINKAVAACTRAHWRALEQPQNNAAQQAFYNAQERLESYTSKHIARLLHMEILHLFAIEQRAAKEAQ